MAHLTFGAPIKHTICFTVMRYSNMTVATLTTFAMPAINSQRGVRLWNTRLQHFGGDANKFSTFVTS